MPIWRSRHHARDLEARLEALKSDLQALQHDMKGLAHAAGQATGKAWDGAREQTDDTFGALQDSVRRQPLAAIILSVGAGALAGALLARR